MKNITTKQQLIARINPRYYETVCFPTSDTLLIVTRNTKGNLLPGHTQEMTVKEAIDYGAWDSVRGTMEFSIRLKDASVDGIHFPVSKTGRFVYYIQYSEADLPK